MLDDALKTRIDNEIASESVVLFMKEHRFSLNVVFQPRLWASCRILG